MTITMPIAEARSKLTRLPRQLHDQDTLTITSRGKPVLTVLPWELFESITETLEIMADPQMLKLIQQGIQDVKKSKTIPWEKVKGQLKL